MYKNNYKDKVEYLKRAIKRTYKRYTGERNDGEATIKDVACFFNIPVDEARFQDYSIEKIDYNIPSIEIYDEKTNTLHTAKYTSDADLLNYSSGKVSFVSVKSSRIDYETDSLYYIGDKDPIIETITFVQSGYSLEDGSYYLKIEKEKENSISIFSPRGNKVVIRLSQNIDGKDKMQVLYSKIYDDKCNDHDYFEQFFTYGINNFVKVHDRNDKYTYVVDQNVICGNNEYENADAKTILRSICFENARCKLQYYFPMNMYVKNFPDINVYDSDSLMLFSGFIDHFSNSLEIYKSNGFFIKFNYEQNSFSFVLRTCKFCSKISLMSITSNSSEVLIIFVKSATNSSKISF